MTGITIVQVACRKIKDTDKERYEQKVLVHLGYRRVHGGNDTVGHRLVSRNGTEDASGNRHEERSRNALARNVTDAEEELIIAEIEIEQVAAHLFGRNQRSIELYVVAIRISRELRGKHTHLDAACDMQVALYRSFLGSSILQFFDIFHK